MATGEQRPYLELTQSLEFLENGSPPPSPQHAASSPRSYAYPTLATARPGSRQRVVAVVRAVCSLRTVGRKGARLRSLLLFDHSGQGRSLTL